MLSKRTKLRIYPRIKLQVGCHTLGGYGYCTIDCFLQFFPKAKNVFLVSPSVRPFWIYYYILLKFRRFFQNLLEFVTYLSVE